ncbi:hypothetical protein Bca52824_072621 [Brassica carinata]|uniref:Uncharacterized protein n=1 Tax=Brassica carinata TaxID=52824 RepID=A0A8X7QA03_BRACI|nr:hypothetical protein Bca52824_072621 [Brassica carinata]
MLLLDSKTAATLVRRQETTLPLGDKPEKDLYTISRGIDGKALWLRKTVKPTQVVRFQLKNNKLPEPKVPVRLDLDDHELEPKEKSFEERERVKTAEGEVEVVRFKSR